MAYNARSELRSMMELAVPEMRPAIRELIDIFESTKAYVTSSLANDPTTMPEYSAFFLKAQLDKMCAILDNYEANKVGQNEIDAVGKAQLYAIMDYDIFHKNKVKQATRAEIAEVRARLVPASEESQRAARRTIFKELMVKFKGMVILIEATRIKEYCSKYNSTPLAGAVRRLRGRQQEKHNAMVVDIMDDYIKFKERMAKKGKTMETSDVIKAVNLIVEEACLSEKGKTKALSFIDDDKWRREYLAIYAKFGDDEEDKREAAIRTSMTVWFGRSGGAKPEFFAN